MGISQGRLFADPAVGVAPTPTVERIEDELARFERSGRVTRVERVQGRSVAVGVPAFVNEFWTSRQRAAHSLHEVSYRACFKPQLPRFFIDRLTRPGDTVHDPFLGRGTTLLEAALLGRRPSGADVNPLSRVLVEPRLDPPGYSELTERLDAIDFDAETDAPAELLVFYHRDTLRELCALREYLRQRERDGTLDRVDRFLRMVAVNRLTGHSSGFFSVYTLPPNQAVSLESQRKINARRSQEPPRRDVPGLIAKKARSLLADCDDRTREAIRAVGRGARVLTRPAADTPEIPDASVDLVVTSPPFLDVVHYASDNWLRCWFCGFDAADVPITMSGQLEDWEGEMTAALRELHRVVRPGGHVAFEVGEVRGGRVHLERSVIDCGVAVGLEPRFVLWHDQQFTKTANCWGVSNNRKGTNTQRVAVFRRPGRSDGTSAEREPSFPRRV